MQADLRAAARFFSSVESVAPVASLTHLHWVNASADQVSTVTPLLLDAGFAGTVVVARASQQQAMGAFSALNCALHDHPSAGQAAGDVLLEAPQGREAAQLAIAQIQAAMVECEPHTIWVFGDKESGIQSLAKRYVGASTALSKGHLRLVRIPACAPLVEATNKKGRAPFAFPTEANAFHTFTWDGLTLATRPGVFSWRHADAASTLLLKHLLAENLSGQWLDWGCGCGLLGAALLRQFPDLRVVMSDDHYRAAVCTQQTLDANALQARAQVICEDGVGPRIGALAFDGVVTNPPFHRGVRLDRGVAQRFLRDAQSILKPGGVIWLVGNRHLDYGAALQRDFSQVSCVESNAQFHIWRAQRR
ncbi:class I SAM-dependent methyltransferase [Magnetofaba australis]|uniref:Putative rRNA (Guanine-N(2)-)-methyltransferase n=1 Tax=Magnetofaba australis IT-1 TaxID=1434232 RepID=A0A1Y2JZP4_9PROT|nr:methyltransferase [Magnetofaba australis]OSM00385.1 putative rRNA (guanine-N(2)-)-methyltransferase [Magnetofaba australis IT-1]